MQLDYTNIEPNPAIDKTAHLRAHANIQYLKFIDLIKEFWEKGHPDVKFVPFAGNNISDPDKGYVVYSLESRVPSKDWQKPRFMESIKDSSTGKVWQIYAQMFENFVSFNCVHQNPRTAEEICEAFDDFMIEFTPQFRALGISDLWFSRRFSDKEQSRIGEDVAVRTTVYKVITQKLRKIERDVIETINIEARVWWDNYNNNISIPKPDPNPAVTTSIVDDFNNLQDD